MNRQAVAAFLLLGVWMTGWPAGADSADSARGRQIYDSRCGGCHAVDDNGPGPRHREVYGRRAGTQPGFEYSAALSGSNLVWNEITLDRWLQDPSALVPGNKMVVQLVPEARDRADVIGYLRSLSVDSHAQGRP